ncbi:MAG: tRNA epoxyqueuosine(34) reductase QueG [Candidatus Hodarchaeota archaeon]
MKLGKSLGFEIVKICSADPFDEYEKIVKERISAKLYPEELIPYEEILRNVEIFADPSNSLSEAKSIISVAFHYFDGEPTDFTKKGEPHGILARAYQRDVYGEMQRRLREFAIFLQQKGMKVMEKSCVPHKMAAVRAGVGWQGKNSLILHEKLGSWMLLGSLIVDKRFEVDEQLSRNCGSCQACQRACPTSAIQAAGIVNVNRCVDYLTCKTGSIPKELRSNMENRLVSCDRCQEVCPFNIIVKPKRKSIPTLAPEFRHSPALIPLLNVSEETFQKVYLDCDFIDPSVVYLKRNAIVALGNLGDHVAKPALRNMLKDISPLLREHAEWALNKIEN